MKILVAGGAGYIGSHTCVALLNSGHDVIVIDSLVNSQFSSVDGIQQITGKAIDFFNWMFVIHNRLIPHSRSTNLMR